MDEFIRKGSFSNVKNQLTMLRKLKQISQNKFNSFKDFLNQKLYANKNDTLCEKTFVLEKENKCLIKNEIKN